MLLNLSLLGALGLASIATAKTVSVAVGAGGFTFSPNSITADVGDEVTFTISPGHSVVEGNGFANPCAFKPGGFFSGFSASQQTFTIAVTSTSPVWLYCSTQTHCQLGMVAVINQSGQNTLEAYATAAKGTSGSTDPGAKTGGITPGSSGSSSSSSSAPSSASESSAASSASSSSPASSSESSVPASSAAAPETTTTPTPGTNATASFTVTSPPVQQTGAASAFTAETAMVNAFVGLIAVVAGWAGFL